MFYFLNGRFKKVRKHPNHIIDHLIRQGRIHPDPERLVHGDVRIVQVAHDAVADVLVRWLAQQVAAKQQSCRHLVGVQMLHKRVTAERRVGADGEQEAEPAWLAVRRGDGQHEEFGKRP